MKRVNHKGEIPFWLILLILGLVVLTLLIILNNKVFGGIFSIFSKLGGAT